MLCAERGFTHASRASSRFTQALSALDQSWHPACFTCCRCNTPLADRFVERNGDPYCTKCGHEPDVIRPVCVCIFVSVAFLLPNTMRRPLSLRRLIRKLRADAPKQRSATLKRSRSLAMCRRCVCVDMIDCDAISSHFLFLFFSPFSAHRASRCASSADASSLARASPR